MNTNILASVVWGGGGKDLLQQLQYIIRFTHEHKYPSLGGGGVGGG